MCHWLVPFDRCKNNDHTHTHTHTHTRILTHSLHAHTAGAPSTDTSGYMWPLVNAAVYTVNKKSESRGRVTHDQLCTQHAAVENSAQTKLPKIE
jgi:hypothetical protein